MRIDDGETPGDSIEKVLAATTFAGFARDPLGKYVSGQGWLYFSSSSGELFGILCWGRVSATDLDKLKAGMDAGLSPALPPHLTLVDARRLESLDAASFTALGGYIEARRTALSRAVRRLAVVHPGGLLGSVAEGFYRIVSPPYPVEVFRDLAPALAWLGISETSAAAVRDAEAIQAAIVGLSPFVRDLQALMEASPADLPLSSAARALGLSTRTFQRRLSEAGIQFKAELAAARVRLAKKRLEDPTMTITALAFALGFSSPQHFSNCFRRMTGRSPSRWRAELRRG